MIDVIAIKGSADSVSQGLFRKGRIRLDDSTFPMSPLRFNRVEPGTFDRQKTNQDADSFSGVFDVAIMLSDPGAHGFASVPAGIVPNHGQHRFVQFLDFLAGPLQKPDRNIAYWATIHETQEHFFYPQIIAGHPTQQNTITSQGLGVRVIFVLGLLHQSQRLFLFTPT
jgi:hypothetical protein